MKILAICFGEPDGSGVLVFYQRIVEYLGRTNEVDVLSDTKQITPFVNVRQHHHVRCSVRNRKWYLNCLRWFRMAPIPDKWCRKACKAIDRDYDVILSMTGTPHTIVTALGRSLAKRLGCKFAIYTTDAIPAPGGWVSPEVYRSRLQDVRRSFPAADYLAAANPHMLRYQLDTFKDKCKKNIETDVLLTPSPSRSFIYDNSLQENIFLYTGVFYNLRRVDHFLKAFKRLLAVYPDAQFYIVGKGSEPVAIDRLLTEQERQHVHLAKHTSDLDPYFSRAKVLVDIDADLNKDPFLSSKIATYIKVNRVILCETGKITPSREMFAGMQTIIQCDHNEDSLYNGMLRAIEVANSNPDFSERDALVEQFSIESVTATLQAGLERTCKIK